MKRKWKQAVQRLLPDGAVRRLKLLDHGLAELRNRRNYRGGSFYCPVCDAAIREYRQVGDSTDCPICRAGERSRCDWYYLRTRTDLFAPGSKSLLHVAPEIFFLRKFRSLPSLDYVTIDLASPLADQLMDLTDLKFSDHRFDVIYCSHVLEHIENDGQALAELFRVCKPGGWALLQVPVTATQTFEDPAVVVPAERLRLFGNEGHVRRCGPDYVERMRRAGFVADAVPLAEFTTPDFLRRMGIQNRNRYVFHCRKPF